MSRLLTPSRCLTVALILTATVLTIFSVLKVSRIESFVAYSVLSPIAAYWKQQPSQSFRKATAAGIPRLLHFAADSELVLTGYRLSLASCAAANSDWTIYLWTREDVESLLRRRQPDLLHYYQSLGSQSERLEFAKYPVLYHLGGVALESDVECRKPLSAAAADFQKAFVAEEREVNILVYDNRLFRLSPAAMGSEPGHGFLGFVISVLLGRVSVDNPSLDKDFLSACYRQWLTLDNNGSVLAVLPSEVFSPSLEDPDTMRLLCGYHREANLSRVYRLRDKGCAMLAAADVANATIGGSVRTVGAHLHLQPARLELLQRLLAHGESGDAAASHTVGGRFNATELLKALRFSKLPPE